MKSKIIIISIFLLFICLMGSAAALDNETDIADDIQVSYNTTVYKEDLGSISVDVPENTSGNLKATINDVEFYSQNITSSVEIPISIPDNAFPRYVANKDSDHINFKLNVFFNSTLLKSNHTLKVMTRAPDYSVMGFQSEILKDDKDTHAMLYFPESACGEIKVYIDGCFSQNLTASHYTFLNSTPFYTLALGNHNVTVVYAGDSYYKKFNKTFNFTVVDMTIYIPVNIILDHDDCISGKTLKNTDGVVTIYIDDKAVFQNKLDKYGEFLHSMFDDITCGEHLIRVTYNAGKFSYSKQELVNVSYVVDTFSFGEFNYGDNDDVVIIVPSDFKKDLITITINDKAFTDFTLDNSGWIEIPISKFDAGQYKVNFTFSGDEKYYSYSNQYNFTIKYGFTIPFETFFDEAEIVSLTLPESAKGSMEVYVNDKLYKIEPLKKGYAAIKIDNLAPGKYNFTFRYNGDDFNVSDYTSQIKIYPDIISSGDVYYGEDGYVSVKTMKDVRGKVIFSINDKNTTVDIKDGKAVLSLKNFKIGSYDVDAYYFDDTGFNTTLYTFFEVVPSTIRLADVKVTSENAKMKVYINSKLVKNTYVTFKIDNAVKKIKTDKNGIATIKLAPGKHKITATFANAKSTKTVNVHVITLKTVKVKKSAKKLVLTATLKQGKKYLKNKVVTFKFNGKTYKAKSNKKGVAKVTVKKSVLKKLKIGKKITYQASYAKDTVKKTVTVKK